HLRGCPTCRHATDEFSVILDKMPIGDTDVDEKALVALQRDSYRDRFLKRAVAEGVPLSHAVMRSRFSFRTWLLPRFKLIPALATAAIIIIVFLSLQVFRLRDEASRVSRKPSMQQSARIAQTLNPEGEQRVPELEAKVTVLQKLATQQQNTISDVKAELNRS